MATFSKIDGAEPSTVTFRLATVTQDRGGVTQHQEIVTLGGSESTLAVAQVRAAAPASTEFGLVVRVADPSTGPFAVSSIAGPVTVRSSKADALVTVYQSTAADLNVTVAGYVAPSTTVNVSSLAGAVITRSSKADMLVTVYQSSAADLNVTVAGYVAPSTTVAVSTLQGRVAIAGFHAVSGIVNVTDSTNNAINVNVVAGAAGGSTVVTVNGNASSNSSLYLPVRLTNGTAFLTPSQDYTDGSTASNLTGPVLTFDNGSNATMRAVSLTLGLPVNVVGGSAAGSTTVNVSSLAGAVITRSSKADMLVSVYQSTASELKATVTPDSTAWSVLARNTTSSGGGVEGSTTAPAGGVIGIHVREALQDLLSTRAVITSSNSTALYTLVSSAAGLKHKVYAYSLTSTETTPSTIVFMSSNVIDRWAVSFGSGSSGISGANFSVSPPAYLFKTDVHNALRCLIEKAASTRCDVTLSFSYFSEP